MTKNDPKLQALRAADGRHQAAILGAAAKLAEAINAARTAGYHVSMPFQVEHLAEGAIGISSTDKSNALAVGDEPPRTRVIETKPRPEPAAEVPPG